MSNNGKEYRVVFYSNSTIIYYNQQVLAAIPNNFIEIGSVGWTDEFSFYPKIARRPLPLGKG